MNSYLDKKYIAELVGTLALVLVGCGAVTIGGFGDAFPLGILPIALAFGLTVTAMAYGVGAISGAHLNPAVTVAMWVGGRIRTEDVAGYIIAQCVGAILAAGLLVLILKGRQQGWDLAREGPRAERLGTGFSRRVWSWRRHPGGDSSQRCCSRCVILGSTSGKGATPFPGLVIGLTLTALHFPFINVTGLSVNPARSLGPAVFVGGNALVQLWLFLVVPTIAGAVAGWLVKSKHLDI